MTPTRFLRLREASQPVAARTQDNVGATLDPLARAVGATPIMGAPPPHWVTLQPLNGFAQTGGTQKAMAYQRDALGYVWTAGSFTSVAGAAAAVVAWSYPKGLRPGAVVHFAVKGTAGTVQFISVSPNGDAAIEVAVAAGGFVDVYFAFLAER